MLQGEACCGQEVLPSQACSAALPMGEEGANAGGREMLGGTEG